MPSRHPCASRFSAWLVAVAMAAVAMPGCAGRGGDADPASAPPTLPYEVTVNPRLLIDPAAPIDQLSVRGVRLGDPRSAISPRRVIEENDFGWVYTRDLSRYRLMDGKVVTVGCWDGSVLEQLGVASEEDVERAFGKAEQKLQLSHNIVSFHYQDGRKRAIWNRFEQRLVAVNVGKASADTTGSDPAPDAAPPAKR